MSRRRLIAAAAAVILLTAAVAGTGAGLLTVLPFVLLLATLACGRYPGEAVLGRLGAPRRQPVKRAPVITAPVRAPRSLGPRGGALIASGLASRPPPVRPLAFSC